MQTRHSSRFSRSPDSTARTGQTYPCGVPQSGPTAFAINVHVIQVAGRRIEALHHGLQTRLSPSRHEDTGKFEKDASEHELLPE